MNWDAIGAIGQVLGSVAVFVTLIYLAMQVRHSRADARRSMTLQRLDFARQNTWNLARSPVLATRIRLGHALGVKPSRFISAVMDLGASEEDAYRLYYENFAVWTLFVLQIQNGDQLTAEERDAVQRNVRVAYGTGVGKLWYELYARDHADASVVQHVDELLA